MNWIKALSYAATAVRVMHALIVLYADNHGDLKKLLDALLGRLDDLPPPPPPPVELAGPDALHPDPLRSETGKLLARLRERRLEKAAGL
jgi:hypothetical protein